MPPDLTFGLALEQLRRGGRATRRGWNGGGQWLVLVAGWHTDGTPPRRILPFLALSTVAGDLVPWTPSQTDVLAEDWVGNEP